jgi:hypothetical protein
MGGTKQSGTAGNSVHSNDPQRLTPNTMILRPNITPCSIFLCLLILLVPSALADDSPFDCHIAVDNAKFDITSLAGEHKVFLARDMPPSTMVQKLRFNLCKDLDKLEGVADQDQVRNQPSGAPETAHRFDSSASRVQEHV